MIRIELQRAAVRCAVLELAEVFGDGGDVMSAFTALLRLAGERQRDRQCSITVHEPWYQQRVLSDLPHVSRRTARRIVQLDAGRQFRGREPVAVDGAWMREVGGARVFTAVAIPERLLQQLDEVCTAAGWTLNRAAPSSTTSALRWVPAVRQHQQARRWRQIGLAAWVSAACVLLGTGWRSYAHLAERRAALGVRAQALAPRTATLEALARDRERLTAEVRVLDGSGRTDRLLARTAHLLGALPDSAYVARLLVRDTGAAELSGGAYRVSAVAAAATRMRLPVQPASLNGAGPDPHRRGWTAFSLRTERDGW